MFWSSISYASELLWKPRWFAAQQSLPLTAWVQPRNHPVMKSRWMPVENVWLHRAAVSIFSPALFLFSVFIAAIFPANLVSFTEKIFFFSLLRGRSCQGRLAAFVHIFNSVLWGSAPRHRTARAGEVGHKLVLQLSARRISVFGWVDFLTQARKPQASLLPDFCRLSDIIQEWGGMIHHQLHRQKSAFIASLGGGTRSRGTKTMGESSAGTSCSWTTPLWVPFQQSKQRLLCFGFVTQYAHCIHVAKSQGCSVARERV